MAISRVRDSSENVFLCCACGKKALQRIARPEGERPKNTKKDTERYREKYPPQALYHLAQNTQA
jgi:hypothetical protein